MLFRSGVTLPFISYGGSSVLTTLIMFAVIEGLCMIRLDEKEQLRLARARKKKKRSALAGGGHRTGIDALTEDDLQEAAMSAGDIIEYKE